MPHGPGDRVRSNRWSHLHVVRIRAVAHIFLALSSIFFGGTNPSKHTHRREAKATASVHTHLPKIHGMMLQLLLGRGSLTRHEDFAHTPCITLVGRTTELARALFLFFSSSFLLSLDFACCRGDFLKHACNQVAPRARSPAVFSKPPRIPELSSCTVVWVQ